MLDKVAGIWFRRRHNHASGRVQSAPGRQAPVNRQSVKPLVERTSSHAIDPGPRLSQMLDDLVMVSGAGESAKLLQTGGASDVDLNQFVTDDVNARERDALLNQAGF